MRVPKPLAIRPGDYCLATPAVSNGALFIRSQKSLSAAGAK